MYAWYKRVKEQEKTRLTFEESTSIGGCNNGIIAIELQKAISPSDSAPFGWTLPISETYNKEDYSFIIDIKPNSPNQIFICELDRAFGFCYEEWTPIMLRLKCLDIVSPSKEDFYYPADYEVIYTMYYLQGTVSNGALKGTWNPPFGSLTSLLFWPEAMTFFFDQVKRMDANFLENNVKLMKNWNQYSI
jgi:hypothetical protein